MAKRFTLKPTGHDHHGWQEIPGGDGPYICAEDAREFFADLDPHRPITLVLAKREIKESYRVELYDSTRINVQVGFDDGSTEFVRVYISCELGNAIDAMGDSCWLAIEQAPA